MRLTFLIRSSASAQRQAVELSGRRSLEAEQGRLRYNPFSWSGRSLNRSSARTGTESVSPPYMTRRNSPVFLWSELRGMRSETLREVSSVLSISKDW